LKALAEAIQTAVAVLIAAAIEITAHPQDPVPEVGQAAEVNKPKTSVL
jgi:hypothetical protein